MPSSGRRRGLSGCPSTMHCGRRSRSTSPGSDTRRSRIGPGERTSRGASAAPTKSTRSSSLPCGSLTSKGGTYPAETLRVAGKPDPCSELAEGRDRIVSRLGDEQNGRVLRACKRRDEQLEADGEREGLVGQRPAERHELLGP